ncbi:hypothetical protein [Arthrobacter sp.]|nr:hypothetical protein [Arthrobacter sp.]
MAAKPAAPMSYERRLASYGGSEARLTPRQRRRLTRKRHHADARARKR